MQHRSRPGEGHMQRRRRHHIKNLTLACLLTAGVALAQEKISFDIPEQDASTAIQSWARQSGLQVFAADEHLRGIRTHAVHGDYSPLQAVQILIAGTGLEAVSTGEKTVTIRRPAPTSAVSDPPGPLSAKS